ncbi:hypothetical protein [Mycobacterium intracellulare]|uniref:hypothetical protein n=1 Tax=Mycobacterium intracellulare TaxID=1767 RepID=UPI0006CA9AE3|nr:hypothetical protein [Mycobacterium intracellulare]KPN46025.1 hypothetical protein AN933_26760 [Mycobacterium intracellulare subsp. chimaera]
MTANANQQPGPWVERWLSRPRFGVYLAAVGDDRQLALDRYEWNAVVSAAFHHDLAHLEVALRNAYDIIANTPSGLPHWTADPYRLFPVRWRAARDSTRIDANRAPREQIERAVRAAGPGAPPGKVIAELTFGFWRYLSITAHHHPLWIPYLHKAFATGTSRPAVDRPIGRLHQLRNRIAHHEPLLRRNSATGVLSLTTQHLVDLHADLLTVADLISPELREYIEATSNVRYKIDKISQPS